MQKTYGPSLKGQRAVRYVYDGANGATSKGDVCEGLLFACVHS